MAPEYNLMLEWRDYIAWTFTNLVLFIICLYYLGRTPSKTKGRVETEEERDVEISSPCTSNSQHPHWKYRVFLSFRGHDTRKTFTGHLYKALESRGIYTFQDDKRLEHGKPISELFKGIEQAQVALIIFSENYASSTWCLNELVKIMECQKINEYGESSVIPIFYNVDPSTVRHQRGSFYKAFHFHELRFCGDVEGMQKVQRWRTALTDAASLKGYDIRQRIEADCIQEIVDKIFSTLCKYHVFLSFCGDDTRKSFTGHLYKGLENRGIYTFQDDKRLEHDTPISTKLFKAIEQAQVALVIFFENYARSTRCLDELVKIMECKKSNQYGQGWVIPIFYDVDPSAVRNQTGSFFEKAFDRHVSRFNDDVEGMQKMQRWRTALTAAANLKGYEILERIEADCIQEIVDQVSSTFYKNPLSH